MYSNDPTHPSRPFADTIARMPGRETERVQIALYGAPLEDDPYRQRTPIALAERDPAVARRILTVATARPPHRSMVEIPYIDDAAALALIAAIVERVAASIASQSAFLAKIAAASGLAPEPPPEPTPEPEASPAPADDDDRLLAMARTARRRDLDDLRAALKRRFAGAQPDGVRRRLERLLGEIRQHELFPNSENNERLEPLMAALLDELAAVTA